MQLVSHAKTSLAARWRPDMGMTVPVSRTDMVAQWTQVPTPKYMSMAGLGFSGSPQLGQATDKFGSFVSFAFNAAVAGTGLVMWAIMPSGKTWPGWKTIGGAVGVIAAVRAVGDLSELFK